MYNSGIYSYINVLDKAADASWLRNELISNNIANQDTTLKLTQLKQKATPTGAALLVRGRMLGIL